MSKSGISCGSVVPLIAHVVHGFSLGGLESKLLTLLKMIPEGRYRHVVICMTDEIDGLIHELPPKIGVVCIHKKPGHDVAAHVRLLKIFEKLRPTIVHTRNIGTLEAQVAAALAGVPARIHGVHGWNIDNPDGNNKKYLLLNKTLRPLVHKYVAVSGDLANWLVRSLRVPRGNVAEIHNGVDVEAFRPRNGPRTPIGPPGFIRVDSFVVGTVGGFRLIKAQSVLVEAVAHLAKAHPQLRERLRLILVGDGPSYNEVVRAIREFHCEGMVWLPGSRRNISEFMQAFDVFALPSLGEGMSNTILEAMASGLPVVATRVGGNPELVDEGPDRGTLVRRGDPGRTGRCAAPVYY